MSIIIDFHFSRYSSSAQSANIRRVLNLPATTHMEYKSNNGTSRPIVSVISSERRFQTRCRTSRASASPPWENVRPCHDVKRVAIIGNSEAIPLLCTWQTTLLVTRVALQPRCMRLPHLTPRHLAQQESNSIRSCWLANLWDCGVPRSIPARWQRLRGAVLTWVW